MSESVKDSLAMAHLTEQKAQVDAQYAEAQARPAQAPVENKSMRTPEATFTVEYTNLHGKVYKGEFRNKALTIGEKIKVDVIRARRMMNASKEALSDSASGLLYMVSWMEESLKSAPAWAKNLWEIYDEGLVEAIFLNVAEHERCFHGRPALEGAGQG